MLSFTLYFDEPYMKWASLLVKSIKYHHPEAYIICNTIGISKETTHQLYEDRVYIFRNDLNFVPNVNRAWQIIEHKISFLLNSISLDPDATHVLLDSDMLLLKPLPAVNEMKKYDMGGFIVHETKIAGGILLVTPTAMSMNFLHRWNKYLMDGNYFNDKDQPSLAKFYNEYKLKGLKWLQLDRTYLDHKEKDDAHIWSAHKSEFGTKDKRYEKYVKKLDEMTNTQRKKFLGIF